jgi:hypothetical protein
VPVPSGLERTTGHGFGFYGEYSGAWVGYYEPPTIYQYDVYISETSLYDMVKNQLVWTGTVETRAPADINAEISHYVDKVIKALKSKHLLASGVIRDYRFTYTVSPSTRTS